MVELCQFKDRRKQRELPVHNGRKSCLLFTLALAGNTIPKKINSQLKNHRIRAVNKEFTASRSTRLQ